MPNRTSVSRRPDIFVLITDQQFADATSGRMGNDLLWTPAMDSLAAAGMVFRGCHKTDFRPEKNHEGHEEHEEILFAAKVL